MSERQEAPAQGAPAPRLIRLTDWPRIHGYPPLGTLRDLAFRARENGFDRVIRRVGRRVLIDERAYWEWFETQQKHDPKDSHR